MEINGHNVLALSGTLPTNFSRAVNMLMRPYISITKDEYNSLIDLTSKGTPTDFVMYDGIKCTFGNADNGYALMPLINQH